MKNGLIKKELKLNSYQNGITIWQKYEYPTEGDIVKGNRAETFEVQAGSNKFEVTVANGLISDTRNFTEERDKIIGYIILFVPLAFVIVLLLIQLFNS